METTRLCLINSPLQAVVGQDLSFITTELLARPPFPFLRAIIKLFVVDLSFAHGLYKDQELDLDVELSRKEKISFLVKILSCVAIVTGERHDILVSPARVLSGHDVLATHAFLLSLARAGRQPLEQSKEAAEKVLLDGETALYRRAVRTRNAFVKVQALYRGRLSRKRNDEGGSPVAAEGIEYTSKPTVAAVPMSMDISENELSDDDDERDAADVSMPAEDCDDGPASSASLSAMNVEEDVKGKLETIEPISPLELNLSVEPEALKVDGPEPQADAPISAIDPPLPPESDEPKPIETKAAEPKLPVDPPLPAVEPPAKFYVGLDGKKQVAKKESSITRSRLPGEVSKQIAIVAECRTLAPDEKPKTTAPQHQEMTKPNRPAAPKKQSIPRIKPTARAHKKSDACTSVELDSIENARDMTELHNKQLQHREAVEKFNKAEANLKARVHKTKEKEEDLKRKEEELKERKERVTRVADNLRRQQHLLRQKEDASALKLNRQQQGSGATARLDYSVTDSTSAAEIKGLRRKLFRSDRRVQKREEQIRALVKRLRKLKGLQRSQDTCTCSCSTAAGDVGKLTERANNVDTTSSTGTCMSKEQRIGAREGTSSTPGAPAEKRKFHGWQK